LGDAEVQDDQDFVLEVTEDMPVDMDAVLPQIKDDENAMAIDEEGRPRFAPATDTVRL
jgi:hypothetical protein